MIRSTAEEGEAEFQDDEDSAEQTDEGGGGGDGPKVNEDLKCMRMTLNEDSRHVCTRRATSADSFQYTYK